MSKILQATCAAGVVQVGVIPVPTATILSQGTAPSLGILILDEDEQTYIPKNNSDLEDTLEAIADALSQIATTLTSIGAAMTGPTTAPPPTLAVDVANLVAIQAQVTLLAETLK